jgi:hypothetical protein
MLTLIAGFLGIAVAAPAPSYDQLSKVLVPHAQIEQFAEKYEVIGKTRAGYEVLVPASDTAVLAAKGIEVLEQDIDKAWRAAANRDQDYLSGYRTFMQVQATLADWVARFPDKVQLIEYGRSAGGNPLLAVKISDNVATDEDEPEVMLTSATHGDELITVEVLLRLVEEILAGDNSVGPVADLEMFIIPVVNPDGFVRQSRYANGVDPNREYPWPERPTRSPETCIAKVMEFFAARNIVGSIDFHASGQMIMYPWAWTSEEIEDGDARQRFEDLGTIMATENNYSVGQISRIIYVAKGSSADYYFWQKGTIAYGIELATTKVPPTSSIDRVVSEARAMTFNFLDSFTAENQTAGRQSAKK